MEKNRKLLTLILFLIFLGSSMYGLFTPIFFLSHGVTYQRVISYLIFWCIGGVLSGAISGPIISRFGVRSLIILRGLFEPLSILMLNAYPSILYPPELQGIFSGFIQMSFWVSMDVFTAKSTDLKNRGKQQSSIYSGMLIAGIISPFIGGFIINRLGYAMLFTLSLMLILFGGILSFRLDLKVKSSGKIGFRLNHKGEIGSHMSLIFLRGMTFAMTAWLFVFIIFGYTKSEIMLGSFGTMLSIIALVSNTLAGYLIDRFRLKAIKIFFLMGSAAWFVASIAAGSKIIVAIAAISFFYNMINISLNNLFFSAIEKLDCVSLISERIAIFCLGGIALLAIHLFLPYQALFLICGFSVLVSLYPLARQEKAD